MIMDGSQVFIISPGGFRVGSFSGWAQKDEMKE